MGDERQLPPESIRFFTVDKNWTNQLINGSFAVGAVSEKAETFNRLFAAFPIGWTVARAGKHCLDAQGNPLDILRMEKLSAEILICIYQGKINRLVIREPAEGLRFGAQGDERTIRVRDIQEGKEGKPIPQKELHIGANAPWQGGYSGVGTGTEKTAKHKHPNIRRTGNGADCSSGVRGIYNQGGETE